MTTVVSAVNDLFSRTPYWKTRRRQLDWCLDYPKIQTCPNVTPKTYKEFENNPPPPRHSGLPIPPTVTDLRKPSPVNTVSSGSGNHTPRSPPNSAHLRMTEYLQHPTRNQKNRRTEEWPQLDSNHHYRPPVSLPPIILKVTDDKPTSEKWTWPS
jgi:hypothetical protein